MSQSAYRSLHHTNRPSQALADQSSFLRENNRKKTCSTQTPPRCVAHTMPVLTEQHVRNNSRRAQHEYDRKRDQRASLHCCCFSGRRPAARSLILTGKQEKIPRSMIYTHSYATPQPPQACIRYLLRRIDKSESVERGQLAFKTANLLAHRSLCTLSKWACVQQVVSLRKMTHIPAVALFASGNGTFCTNFMLDCSNE